MLGYRSRCRRIYVYVAFAAALVAAMTGSAGAQSVTGSIQGSVVDQTGVLPGVTVVVTNTATAAARTMVTDATGTFRAELLPVGQYDLSAELQGFAPRKQTGVEVTVGSTLTFRIEMRVSGLAKPEPVVAASPILETTRSQVSSTVGEAAVRNLPVNGRNFINFALLTPGVTTDVRTGDISFAGQRGTLNSLIVDGADNNNTFFGQTIGRTGSGRAPYQFSASAVKEFQVNSNAYSAEYGRAGGAVINVVTKSGTNQPTGEIFEFYRDKSLNANNLINVLNNRDKSPITTISSAAISAAPCRRTAISCSSTTTASAIPCRTWCFSIRRRIRRATSTRRRRSPSSARSPEAGSRVRTRTRSSSKRITN